MMRIKTTSASSHQIPVFSPSNPRRPATSPLPRQIPVETQAIFDSVMYPVFSPLKSIVFSIFAVPFFPCQDKFSMYDFVPQIFPMLIESCPVKSPSFPRFIPMSTLKDTHVP